MSSTASWRTCASATFAGALALLVGCTAPPHGAPEVARALHDGRDWVIEAEQPATRVSIEGGVLDVDSPAGVTLWFTHPLHDPVEIEFDATAIAAGGPNDRVSDLNVFWMATNPDGSAPFTRKRSGKFADYDTLLTYYVGLGGNRNTTTRFRRYVGEPGNRPLLPEHDRSAPDTLLVPNRKQTITLVVRGRHIEYRRDGQALFSYDDPAPYSHGWFALRSTWSHLRIENFNVRER